MEKISELMTDNRMVDHYKTKLFPEHTSYSPTFDSKFGFNNCGNVVKNFDDRLIRVDFQLKPLYSFGNTCQECSGLGEKDERRCFYCNGSGKKVIENKTQAFAITNTLSLLFFAFDCYPSLIIDNDSANKMVDHWPDQWYMIRSNCERGSYGHAVGGVQSPKFTNALKSYYEQKVKEGVETFKDRYLDCELATKDMVNTHRFLTNESKESSFFGNIMAVVRKSGGFYLETEGQNGCTISTESTGMKNYWYRNDDSQSIGCHNLDSALQQLVLLIGLARLSECVFLGL